MENANQSGLRSGHLIGLESAKIDCRAIVRNTREHSAELKRCRCSRRASFPPRGGGGRDEAVSTRNSEGGEFFHYHFQFSRDRHNAVEELVRKRTSSSAAHQLYIKREFFSFFVQRTRYCGYRRIIYGFSVRETKNGKRKFQLPPLRGLSLDFSRENSLSLQPVPVDPLSPGNFPRRSPARNGFRRDLPGN